MTDDTEKPAMRQITPAQLCQMVSARIESVLRGMMAPGQEPPMFALLIWVKDAADTPYSTSGNADDLAQRLMGVLTHLAETTEPRAPDGPKIVLAS